MFFSEQKSTDPNQFDEAVETAQWLAPSIECRIIVNGDQAAVFRHIVTIDLTSIFTDYGPFPACAAVEDQVGAWDTAGQTRTVRTSNGCTFQQLLTSYDYPRYFNYSQGQYTGTSRYLLSSVTEEWWFATVAPGRTSVKWRYTHNPKSGFALPVVWIMVTIWRIYMRKVLQLAKLQVASDAI